MTDDPTCRENDDDRKNERGVIEVMAFDQGQDGGEEPGKNWRKSSRSRADPGKASRDDRDGERREHESATGKGLPIPEQRPPGEPLSDFGKPHVKSHGVGGHQPAEISERDREKREKRSGGGKPQRDCGGTDQTTGSETA